MNFNYKTIPGDHYAIIDDGEVIRILPTHEEASKLCEQTGRYYYADVLRVDQLCDWQAVQRDSVKVDRDAEGTDAETMAAWTQASRHRTPAARLVEFEQWDDAEEWITLVECGNAASHYIVETRDRFRTVVYSGTQPTLKDARNMADSYRDDIIARRGKFGGHTTKIWIRMADGSVTLVETQL